ncbi:hypothetical protein vseg_006024 [Gypsophila vaccaria]
MFTRKSYDATNYGGQAKTEWTTEAKPTGDDEETTLPCLEFYLFQFSYWSRGRTTHSITFLVTMLTR